jgi:hypothetical protein
MNEDERGLPFHAEEEKYPRDKKVAGYGPSRAGKVVVNGFVEGIKKRPLKEETSGRRCYLRGC